MEAILLLVFQIGIPVLLIVIGYFAGRRAEKKHYDSIREREARFLRLPAVPTKQWDTDRVVADAQLVTGAVVVSADYFKRLLAGLRNIVGGEMRSYESLLDRARREAVLRMKEQYPDADIIVNMRLETSAITGEKQQGGVSAVELVAYGTAIKYRA
jgi:uncharacterized protein YbjQ (UPF0145 family)